MRRKLKLLSIVFSGVLFFSCISNVKVFAATKTVSEVTTMVKNAKVTKQRADIEACRAAITALTAGNAKTTLWNILMTVQKEIETDATAKVKAAKTPTKANLQAARVAVNNLPNGNARITLAKVMNSIQVPLETKAVTLVRAAKASPTQSNIDAAIAAYDILPEGNTKTTLISIVQKLIDDNYLDVISIE